MSDGELGWGLVLRVACYGTLVGMIVVVSVWGFEAVFDWGNDAGEAMFGMGKKADAMAVALLIAITVPCIIAVRRLLVPDLIRLVEWNRRRVARAWERKSKEL